MAEFAKRLKEYWKNIDIVNYWMSIDAGGDGGGGRGGGGGEEKSQGAGGREKCRKRSSAKNGEIKTFYSFFL